MHATIFLRFGLHLGLYLDRDAPTSTRATETCDTGVVDLTLDLTQTLALLNGMVHSRDAKRQR